MNKKYAHSIVKISTISESLQLVVHFTNQFSVTIIVTYKPPNVSPTAYLLQFSDLIKSVKTKELVILGDINLNWIDNSSKLLKTTAIKYGLYQLIKDPTRFGKTRNSILDLIFTNQPSKYGISGVINTAVSDHSLMYVIRKCFKHPKCHKNNYIKKVPNSKLSQFNAEFADTDWSNEMSLQNPDHVLSNFHRRVETIRQKFTTCKIHIRQNTVPWVTSDILHLLKKKASSLKAYRSLKTPEAKLIFVQLRNKCNFELYKVKQIYFENQINRTVSNSRTLWQTIKSLTDEN